jgi:hypothetical protein
MSRTSRVQALIHEIIMAKSRLRIDAPTGFDIHLRSSELEFADAADRARLSKELDELKDKKRNNEAKSIKLSRLSEKAKDLQDDEVGGKDVKEEVSKLWDEFEAIMTV